MSYSIVDTPDFNSQAISDSTEDGPEEAIVKDYMDTLRGGIDGFFDTFLKVEDGDISERFGEESMKKMLEQIEESRSMLAGLGVRLPNIDVNFDTTTIDERMHEMGRWIYSHYEADYPWERKLRSQG